MNTMLIPTKFLKNDEYSSICFLCVLLWAKKKLKWIKFLRSHRIRIFFKFYAFYVCIEFLFYFLHPFYDYDTLRMKMQILIQSKYSGNVLRFFSEWKWTDEFRYYQGFGVGKKSCIIMHSQSFIS